MIWGYDMGVRDYDYQGGMTPLSLLSFLCGFNPLAPLFWSPHLWFIISWYHPFSEADNLNLLIIKDENKIEREESIVGMITRSGSISKGELCFKTAV